VPYKHVGARVYVKKKGKWQLLKKHPNEQKARAHARALNANVKHKGD